MYYEGHSSNGPCAYTSQTVMHNFHKLKEYILIKYQTKSNMYDNTTKTKTHSQVIYREQFFLFILFPQTWSTLRNRLGYKPLAQ